MSLRLIERIHEAAVRGGDRVAVRQVWPSGGQAISYRELSESIHRVAEYLRRALPRDGVVLLSCSNRPAYLPAFLGVLEAGMAVFPVAPDLAAAELLDAARRCGAAAMLSAGCADPLLGGAFAEAQSADVLGGEFILSHRPAWPARSDLGSAMLLLSSGTTGQPKIVVRDAKSLDAVAKNMAEAIGFTASDRVLAAVPLCHSYGVEHGLLAPLWAGCEVRLSDGFELSIARRQLAHEGISIFPGVPFMYEMLCAGTDVISLPNIRRAYSAGAPLPRQVFETAKGKLGIRVTQLYGATEIGSVTFNSPEDQTFDAASVGCAMENVRIVILDPDDPKTDQPLASGDEGHVAICAPSMMSGYLDSDESPIADGFFLSGDLGRLDEQGRLTITGRIKLLIDVGGRKVNPLEVEQAIQSHPAVGACVVVPYQISQTLFRLKAIVTPAAPGVMPDVNELREWARRQLSGYKIPRVFEVRATLPRSAAGKILRQMVEP
ncbi:MAG TPA: class I adenylate-forming enzyme family protein [Humisphaera sp.]|jgi:acyl-CoA synthetase (AMP-forming)/AMP-acid ligase II|nr:class I adenylate-forming enzyme family protein [Humisphaera sp.]